MVKYDVMKKLRIVAVAVVLLCAFSCVSCGKNGKDKEEKEIVLTTGFEENEIFFIGTERCTVPELNVYVRTSQSQYEGAFGEEIWDRNIGTETLEQYLKRMALYRLARIKAMKLLAQQEGITDPKAADAKRQQRIIMHPFPKRTRNSWERMRISSAACTVNLLLRTRFTKASLRM